jgi:coproporphyrinogen III oxidase-like Fe-S oxidoreductase
VFGAAGYRAIGMDHFALPEDELSRAVEAHAAPELHGHTVQSARDMVALGISGIGDVQAPTWNGCPRPRRAGGRALPDRAASRSTPTT